VKADVAGTHELAARAEILADAVVAPKGFRE
jgi:hypothetical protein